MLQALCPLIFAQLLTEAAASGHPSSDPPSALGCLWWDSGSSQGSSWNVGRTGKRDGFDKGLAWGGKANLPVSTAWKACVATSALPGMPASQKRAHHGYSMLLSCSAAWQPCTQSITLLNTLLLPQSNSDAPYAHPSNPFIHELTPAALASLSDVFRKGKVCIYWCLSIMLLVQEQIKHRLKLIGMWNYLKNANYSIK